MSKRKKNTLRNFVTAYAVAFLLGGVTASFTTSVAEARANEAAGDCSDRGCILNRCEHVGGYMCWEEPGSCAGSACGG